MKLYLVQHGEAMEKGAHPERPLTDKGAADVERLGRFLNAAGVSVGEIWHSPKPRAVQTAQILERHIGRGAKMVEDDDLSPKMSVASLCRWLETREEDLLIVGHLPHLARLGSQLLADDQDTEILQFSKGGAACLLRGSEEKWRINWMVCPEILPQAGA